MVLSEPDIVSDFLKADEASTLVTYLTKSLNASPKIR